jgi:exocyst complex component 6
VFDHLYCSQEEVCEMIRKSTNLLLTRTFSGCLSSCFRKSSLGLLQMVQIIIDTGYLEQATVYLEEFVANITGYLKLFIGIAHP